MVGKLAGSGKLTAEGAEVAEETWRVMDEFY
jgi:hypothetical protein